jgi:hypothetical protein
METTMKLTPKLTPYSSIVGGGLHLVDEAGRTRFMLMLCGASDGISKEENALIASHIAERFGSVEVPDRP